MPSDSLGWQEADVTTAHIAGRPQMRNHRCFVARKEASDGTHRCEHRDLAKPRGCLRVRHGPCASARMARGVVRVERIGEGPVAVGTRAIVTRRIGRRELNMTVEIAELDPPRSFAVRSLDGPVRGENRGTIEPLDDGRRSRVTYELDLGGHGIGRLLVPLVAKRQAQRGTPRNMEKLKKRLESSA